YVNPEVLIPRPETEMLAEQVINWSKDNKVTSILDIGCGSGALAVSLAKYIEEANLTAVDISENILAVAQENAEKNSVSEKIDFMCLDVKKDDFVDKMGKKFNIVVSNPPYISKEEWKTLPQEVQNYEPRISLCDEADGLSFFPLISRIALSLLTSGGALFFEVGYTQSRKVEAILSKQGYKDVRKIKDLNQIERVVSGVR
ncbi:MAG: peptide chain release factor N(5)-glutamine methyltransferase, partial [bacterium]